MHVERFLPGGTGQCLARGLRAALSLSMAVAFLFALAGAGESQAQSSKKKQAPPEVAFSFDHKNPPGNIAVSPEGRVFMSLHQFYGAPFKLVEVKEDGSTVPFPDAKTSKGLNNVLGIRIDRNGVLWALDGSKGAQIPGRVLSWDTRTGIFHKVYFLTAPAIPTNAFLNDLAVDLGNQAIYITDTAGPDNAALIVLDMRSGEARRVLEGSRFTVPEDLDMVIDGRVVTLDDEPARIGANPITLDDRETWLYFGPMTGRSLYRIRTRDLLNKDLSPFKLEAKVQRHGNKPISDGITVDRRGNVYVTDITRNAIGVISPGGRYEVLHQDDTLLSWPDGFSVGPDNKIYLTVNQLHRSPVLNGGKDASTGKFSIVTFDALAPATLGR